MKFFPKILLTAISVAFISFVFTSLVVYYSMRRTIIEKTYADSTETASFVMSQIDATMYDASHDIRMIAQSQILQNYLANDKNNTLKKQAYKELEKSLLLTGPWNNLLLVNRAGTIICSTLEKNIGERIDKHPVSNGAFNHVLKRNISYYSDLVLSDLNGRPTVVFSSPVLSEDERETIGAVIGHFSWPVVMEILNQTNPLYHVHVFNKNGITIATTTTERNLILNHNHLENKLINKTLTSRSNFSGASVSIHNPKEQVLAATVRESGFLNYKGSGWGVFIEMPLGVAIAPLNDLLIKIVYCFGLGILFFFVIFYLFCRRLVRPIKELVKVTKSVEIGNFSIIAPIMTNDEIGLLSKNFNSMVMKLRTTTTSIEKLNAEIEAHKMTENKLVESETKYSSMFNSAAEGILVADIETKRFTYTNPAVCKMFGYSGEEMQRLRVENIHPKDALNSVLAEFEAQSRGEKVLVEIACIRKDGSIFFASVSACPIILAGRNYNMGFFSDITAQKEAEKTLKYAKILVETVSYAKDQFIANVSHELVTPLNSVIGFSSMMLEFYSKSLDEKQKEYMLHINKGGEQLKTIIETICDVSRIFTETEELSYSNFLLKDIFDDILKLLQEKIKTNQNKISIEIHNNVNLLIKTDKGKLKQILYALISNAIKFSPAGGIIAIKAEKTVSPDNREMVKVSVIDHGIGVDLKDIGRMFLPLEQLDMSIRKKIPGIGLGLAISKQLVSSQ